MQGKLPSPACWQKIFRKSDPDSDLQPAIACCEENMLRGITVK